MRANEVMNNVAMAFVGAQQAMKDRLEPVNGIRTVCAQVTESINEAGDYQLDVQWTTSDCVEIRTRDTGMYSAQSFNLLMALWKVESCIDPSWDIEKDKEKIAQAHAKDVINLNEAMAEETREVKFYPQPYKNQDGETKYFQKFRRVTAIDRAHERTEQMRKDGEF